MKNQCLYFFQGLACIAVVLIHCSFPGYSGEAITSIARFAVPLFFIISGYFQYSEDYESIKNKISKKLRRLLVIILVSSIIYLPISFVSSFTGENRLSVKSWLHSIFSLEALVKALVLNKNPIAGHLWFLFALAYCYIAILILSKYRLITIFCKVSPFILIGGMLCHYCVYLFNFEKAIEYLNEDSSLFRNWLTTGLPFFFIGCSFKINEGKIDRSLKNKTIVVWMILFSALSIAERFIWLFLWDAESDLWIGSVFLAITLFLFAIKNKEMVPNRLICRMGSHYSLFIYILHILTLRVLATLFKMVFPSGHIAFFILPFLVVGVTLIAGVVFYRIIGRLQAHGYAWAKVLSRS